MLFLNQWKRFIEKKFSPKKNGTAFTIPFSIFNLFPILRKDICNQLQG